MKKFAQPQCGAFCLFFLVSLLYCQGTVYGVGLTDIRTGFHRTYSRLVLQFDADVKFQVIKDIDNGTVMIDVLGVNHTIGLQQVGVHPQDAFLKKINVRQSDQLLSVTIILKVPHLRVDHYYMRWPFRIVVDIYPASISGQNHAPSPAGQPQEKIQAQTTLARAVGGDSSQVSKADSLALAENSADSLALLTTPRYDSTSVLLAQSIRPLQKSLNSVKSELQKIARKTGKNQAPATGKRDLVIALIAGFLLLDAIAFGVYFLRRSRKKRPGRRLSTIEPVPAARMHNQDFVEVLKATLDKTEIEEVRKEPEIIRKEPVETGSPQTFEAWQARMTTPRRNAPVAPDLNDVAKDLGSILDATTNTPQLSKEELIGKDGAEFLENLRRHSLG